MFGLVHTFLLAFSVVASIGAGITIFYKWQAINDVMALTFGMDENLVPILVLTLGGGLVPVLAILGFDLVVHLSIVMFRLPKVSSACLAELDRMFSHHHLYLPSKVANGGQRKAEDGGGGPRPEVASETVGGVTFESREYVEGPWVVRSWKGTGTTEATRTNEPSRSSQLQSTATGAKSGRVSKMHRKRAPPPIIPESSKIAKR